jgi:hypothetical protein
MDNVEKYQFAGSVLVVDVYLFQYSWDSRVN